jgi:hypothetical protein
MNEVEFLVDQLKTTTSGDSWHGPCLVKTLDGIDLHDAGTRYLESRHTIWELTNHITYWLEEVYKSVKDVTDLNHEGNDWPEMGTTAEEWARSSNRLEESVNMLADELASWTNEGIARTVPGSNFTFKQMVHGLIHHNLYHAGQINIMKKA